LKSRSAYGKTQFISAEKQGEKLQSEDGSKMASK